MTQVWDENGKVVPVTVLHAEGCKVSQIKSEEKDGYVALQIQMGKYKREFSVGGTPTEALAKVGAELKAADFEVGAKIKITGVSKGRGFAGPMKRHGFHGAPASHGHDHPRAVGSIGQRFPQHVRPGLRMAGQMGNAKATVKGSKVVAVDAEQNLIFVKGGVPGHPGSLVAISTI